MSPRRLSLATLMLFVLWALPTTARADERRGLQTPDREGAVVGLRLVSGPTLHGPSGFTPVSRISYTLGGAINRRFVLGLDAGATGWWDAKKASFHGDTFAQVFIVRGLFARGSLGVASHTVVEDRRRAAFGGSIGTGWEFPFGKKGFASLELDYDLRLRTDQIPVRTFLVGIRMGAYIGKNRR